MSNPENEAMDQDLNEVAGSPNDDEIAPQSDLNAGSEEDEDGSMVSVTSDVEEFLNIGVEITKSMPPVWNQVGGVWSEATNIFLDGVPRWEEDNTNSDIPTRQERELDPSYQPRFTARGILKWTALWVEMQSKAEAAVKEPILGRIHDWLSKNEPLPSSPVLSNSELEESEGAIRFNNTILGLPLEILTEIVQHAMIDDLHMNIKISHVNSAFRNFALSTPTLWTLIDIMLPPPRIIAHLKRSGTSPLRIRASLQITTLPEGEGVQMLHYLSILIRKHLARIVSLEARFTSFVWSLCCANVFRMLHPLPMLDEFTFGASYWGVAPAMIPSTFLCTPKAARLEGVIVDTFYSIFSDRLISLKVSECQESGLAGWRTVLALVPSLEILEISDFVLRGGGDEPGSLTPVTLPNLRTLTLRHVPRAIMHALLTFLQTPSLVSAKMEFMEYNGTNGYDSRAPRFKPHLTRGLQETVLLPFVSKNPQLKELDVHNCLMGADGWTEVFLPLQNLRKLRISGSDLYDYALHSLVPSENSPEIPPALPSLTDLTLDNEGYDIDSHLHITFIEKLIISRRGYFQAQQENGGSDSGSSRIQPMSSVNLRGWAGHTPFSKATVTEIAGTTLYVEPVLMASSQENSNDEDAYSDSEEEESEWESQSELSWTSGDQMALQIGLGPQMPGE
ncbi:hypothetical protein FRB90_003083 [Tulasnella sp. 427]|nr:hypothetical protein FRB90_003083 [Tulasnella sp. 427]